MNTREGCEELMNSRKFQRLLEIILMIGNYLNTGSRNAQSVGFDLNFLTKVRMTLRKRKFEPPRDKTNKMAYAHSEDSDQPWHCALSR